MRHRFLTRMHMEVLKYYLICSHAIWRDKRLFSLLCAVIFNCRCGKRQDSMVYENSKERQPFNCD